MSHQEYLSSFLSMPFAEAYTDLQFNDANPDTITRAASGVAFDDVFQIGDTVTPVGSASNDSTFTITAVTATTLTVSGDLVAEGTADVAATLNGTRTNFIHDYSGSPEYASYTPPAGKIAIIRGMVISLEDTGSPASVDYGILSGLTNGMDFDVAHNGVSQFYLGNIKSNGDYTRYASKVEEFQFGGAGAFNIRVVHNWDAAGTALVLYGNDPDSFRVNFQDSFAGMDFHTIYLSGVLLADTKANRSRLINWL